MSAARPALPVTLRGVGRRLGAQDVLLDVTFEAPAGQVVVVLGESGAGKSTLLRLVAGLDRPDAGQVVLGDRVVSDAAAPGRTVPAHERGVGLVFQTLELWPHMSVAENVAFGLPGRPRGARASRHPRVLDVARDVGLPTSLLLRRPGTLSGGERQRVAIARALAPAPAVLLYDEPLAHLDPSRRGEIRALVRRLSAPRTSTVLYVTHDPTEAMEVGDLVAVLAHGRVADLGPPDRVRSAPRTLAAARAMGAVSALVASRRAPGRVSCALGKVGANVTSGDGLERGLLLLRPEQVRVDRSGLASAVAGLVVDAFRVPGGWAFRARLPSGECVEGRHDEALAPGQSVSLAVAGEGVLVPPAPDEVAGIAPVEEVA